MPHLQAIGQVATGDIDDRAELMRSDLASIAIIFGDDLCSARLRASCPGGSILPSPTAYEASLTSSLLLTALTM